MAKTRRLDLDQNLTGTWPIEIETVSISSFSPGPVGDGGFGFHSTMHKEKPALPQGKRRFSLK